MIDITIARPPLNHGIGSIYDAVYEFLKQSNLLKKHVKILPKISQKSRKNEFSILFMNSVDHCKRL